MDTLPLITRLQQASETLQEVADLAGELPEKRDDAVAMVVYITLARSYLVELALNLVKGKEPYDAALTTAQGLTPIK